MKRTLSRRFVFVVVFSVKRNKFLFFFPLQNEMETRGERSCTSVVLKLNPRDNFRSKRRFKGRIKQIDPSNRSVPLFQPEPEANFGSPLLVCCDNHRTKTAEEEERITRGPDTRSSSPVASVEKGGHVKDDEMGRGRKCHQAEPKLRPEVAGHVTGATRDIVRRHNKPSPVPPCPKCSISLSLSGRRRRRREERETLIYDRIRSDRVEPIPPFCPFGVTFKGSPFYPGFCHRFAALDRFDSIHSGLYLEKSNNIVPIDRKDSRTRLDD